MSSIYELWEALAIVCLGPMVIGVAGGAIAHLIQSIRRNR